MNIKIVASNELEVMQRIRYLFSKSKGKQIYRIYPMIVCGYIDKIDLLTEEILDEYEAILGIALMKLRKSRNEDN